MRIRSKSFYEESMTHASVVDELEAHEACNERLEFLGDAILGSIVASWVYEMHPEEDEGPLTVRKSNLVSRKSLNRIAHEMDLGRFLRAKMNPNHAHSSVLGNALEALIGALFMDLGYAKTEKAVHHLFAKHGVKEFDVDYQDYKSAIHQWSQLNHRVIEYDLIREFEAQGQLMFEVCLRVNGEEMGKGEASSKKKAEQAAAESAWNKLKIDA